MSVSLRLRRKVIVRAGNRCEYCGLAQAGQEAVFHVDHIVPIVAAGVDDLENLALACVSCSLRKGARQRATDPMTGEETVFFHPRRNHWPEHFRWDGVRMIGVTPIGRATVAALAANRAVALEIRREEQPRGRHPPPGQE